MAQVGRLPEPVKRRAGGPYREPTQVPWLSKPRRGGTLRPREIGKLAPYLRKKGSSNRLVIYLRCWFEAQ